MTGPSPVDRRLYGDLAHDIHLLRTDGRIVARYKAGFRIDSSPEIFTAAQVRGMAAQLRACRQAAASRQPPDRPRARLVNHSITRETAAEWEKPQPRGSEGTAGLITTGPGVAPANLSCGGGESRPADEETPAGGCLGEVERTTSSPLPPAAGVAPGPQDSIQTPKRVAMCPCGRPSPHGGRCWHKRRMPPPGPVVEKVARIKPVPGKVARHGNIAALWAEVDALKSAVERMQRAQSDIRGQLGIGETR